MRPGDRIVALPLPQSQPQSQARVPSQRRPALPNSATANATAIVASDTAAALASVTATNATSSRAMPLTRSLLAAWRRINNALDTASTSHSTSASASASLPPPEPDELTSVLDTEFLHSIGLLRSASDLATDPASGAASGGADDAAACTRLEVRLEARTSVADNALTHFPALRSLVLDGNRLRCERRARRSTALVLCLSD